MYQVATNGNADGLASNLGYIVPGIIVGGAWANAMLASDQGIKHSMESLMSDNPKERIVPKALSAPQDTNGKRSYNAISAGATDPQISKLIHIFENSEYREDPSMNLQARLEVAKRMHGSIFLEWLKNVDCSKWHKVLDKATRNSKYNKHLLNKNNGILKH